MDVCTQPCDSDLTVQDARSKQIMILIENSKSNSSDTSSSKNTANNSKNMPTLADVLSFSVFKTSRLRVIGKKFSVLG